jgi:excinuclease ABC subunit B
VTSYTPRGDQPRAIAELLSGLAAGEKHQVLLRVTGSGKTFTMARIIEQSCHAPFPAFAGPALQPDRISR